MWGLYLATVLKLETETNIALMEASQQGSKRAKTEGTWWEEFYALALKKYGIREADK